MKYCLVFSVFLLCLAVTGAGQALPENLPNRELAVVRVTRFLSGKTLARNTESIAWSPDGKRLLLDQQGLNQFFQIGGCAFPSDDRISILTLKRAAKNTRLHNSTPCWNPAGAYFVFSGQSEQITDYRDSMPGYGSGCELFLADAAGKCFWQLTHAATESSGCTMPCFSPDGTKLLWTRCEGLFPGNRSMQLGEFRMQNGSAELLNIRNLSSGRAKNRFYETYGFSPDGTGILYAANLSEKQDWSGMDICLQNLADREPVKLTDSPETWDRFAAFSPKGHKIIWSSSEGQPLAYFGPHAERWQRELATELWIMNRDGSEKSRLTSFNDRNSPHYAGGRAFVGMSSWHPDGKKIALVLYTQRDAYSLDSAVYLLDIAGRNDSEGKRTTNP